MDSGWGRVMLNCRQATELCSARLDRSLTLRERADLKFHLLMCKGCRHFRDHLVVLRQAMNSYTADVTKSSAGTEREKP
jgi:hypothetical protein